MSFVVYPNRFDAGLCRYWWRSIYDPAIRFRIVSIIDAKTIFVVSEKTGGKHPYSLEYFYENFEETEEEWQS